MTDITSGAGALSHVLAGFAAWWDGDGMAMVAGAGLASLGAIAMATINAIKGEAARVPGALAMPRAVRIKSLTNAYAEPLAAAATDLLWRFKEIIQDHSGHYLGPNAPGSAYFSYKRQSTAYRLAALLGWMRALDRELNLQGSGKHEARRKLLSALDLISAALADGPSLELSRAARLSDVWGLPQFANDTEGGERGGAPNQQLMHDAIEFDVALRKHLPGVDVGDAHALIAAFMKLSRDDLLDLFRKLAFDLARIRGVEPPSPNRVLESVEETARALAYRNAHIYREWQRAIGDVMIRAEHGAPGQPIALLSFAEFEARIAAPDLRAAPWMRRLLDLFEGVEIESGGEHDSRPRQLRRLAEANAALVIALKQMPRSQNMISRDTLMLARTLAPARTN